MTRRTRRPVWQPGETRHEYLARLADWEALHSLDDEWPWVPTEADLHDKIRRHRRRAYLRHPSAPTEAEVDLILSYPEIDTIGPNSPTATTQETTTR